MVCELNVAYRMLTLSSDLDTICNIVNDVVPNLEEVSVKI